MSRMTIKQCTDAAFQLLNQYTIAGTLVPPTYNDEGDDLNRMINLINDAQMTLATTVKPISSFVTIRVPEIEMGDPLKELTFDMPDDFNHAIGIYFTPIKGGKYLTVDANNYKWIGDSTLLLPNKPAGTYRVEYNRFPVRYDPDTDVMTELDNSPDTHEAIPYYVAAMIALDDNPRAYQALYNVWETRLARMGYKPAHATAGLVQDVYGFDSFGGLM